MNAPPPILAITAAAILGACAGEVKLAWNPSEGTQPITYRVWRGIEQLAEVSETTATVTLPDEPVSLTVSAHNEFGSSPHSAPLHLVAVRVQESTNLRAWWYVKTLYQEKKPAAFYRLEIKP
jgi:hypothetical protein